MNFATNMAVDDGMTEEKARHLNGLKGAKILPF